MLFWAHQKLRNENTTVKITKAFLRKWIPCCTHNISLSSQLTRNRSVCLSQLNPSLWMLNVSSKIRLANKSDFCLWDSTFSFSQSRFLSDWSCVLPPSLTNTVHPHARKHPVLKTVEPFVLSPVSWSVTVSLWSVFVTQERSCTCCRLDWTWACTT